MKQERKFHWGGILAIGGMLIGVAFTGCGSKESGGPAANAEAKPSGPHQLIGAWHGEVWVDEAQASQVLTQDQLKAVKGTMMDVEFKADGEMVLSGVNNGKPYTTTGKWELVKQEGPRVVIKSVEAEGAEKEILVRIESQDEFSMSLPDPITRMGAMQFRRMR